MLQPGAIIAFLSYFTIILNALMMVSRLFVMYSKGAASGRRIAEVLDTPADMRVSTQPEGNKALHVAFSRVSFSYAKRRCDVKDISFELCPGERLWASLDLPAAAKARFCGCFYGYMIRMQVRYILTVRMYVQ